MRLFVVALGLGLALAGCGGSGSDDDGDEPSGGAGAGGGGSQGPRAAACEALCERGMQECGADRAACRSECEGLLAIRACAAEVDAVIACQREAPPVCEDGEFAVDGCVDEALAAASCAMQSGNAGAGTSGAGGAAGSAGATGAGGAGGEITSSEAIPLIMEACTSMCSACVGTSECADDCRITGARKVECVAGYLDLVRCRTRQRCARDSCTAEIDALRPCWSPEPSGEELDCLGTCEARGDSGCLMDAFTDLCPVDCTAAAEKPECGTAIDAFTSCHATSHDICLPDGYLFTECTAEITGLHECADTAGAVYDCADCVAGALGASGECADELEQCGDAFMDCFVEGMCLDSCIVRSASEPDGPQTFEECATQCGAPADGPDPRNFRPAVECAACACTEQCASVGVTCSL